MSQEAHTSRETLEALAQIWKRVLGVEDVRPEDDFFDRGGNSLNAIQIVTRVQAVLGVELALRTVLDEPTLESLARKIAELRDAPLPESPVDGEHRHGGVAGPAPVPETAGWRGGADVGKRDGGGETFVAACSRGEERLWLLSQRGEASAAYNMLVALELEGQLDVEALRRAVHSVVARHEPLRSSYEANGGSVRKVVWSAPATPFATVDLSGLHAGPREQELEMLALAARAQPFVLSQSPLLRARVIRLELNLHALLLTLPHLVIDGWSVSVFARDLGEFYRAEVERDDAHLPMLLRSYSEYVAEQLAAEQAGAYDDQLAYWRSQLDGLEPTPLPTDCDRQTTETYAGATVDLALGPVETEALRDLARAEKATLFMVFLSLVAVVLSEYAKRDDVVIGSVVAGRRQPGLDELIGYFVNTIALRLDVGGGPTLRELVRRARDVALDAYSNQDAPFEQVVRAVAPSRDPGRNPLFDVMLVFQNAPAARLVLPSLTVRELSFPATTARFDIVIHLREHENGISGQLSYRTGLFARETVSRLGLRIEEVARELGRDPDAVATHAGGDAATISDDLEAQIAEVWADVLGLPYVGADDDFFEIGGYSLLAAEVVWHLRSVSPTSITTTDVFDARTVAKLAERLRGGADESATAPRLVPRARP